VKLRRCEDVKMRRCEDEKMFYRPPLLEEPCAQTLSGKRQGKRKKRRVDGHGTRPAEGGEDGSA